MNWPHGWSGPWKLIDGYLWMRRRGSETVIGPNLTLTASLGNAVTTSAAGATYVYRSLVSGRQS